MSIKSKTYGKALGHWVERMLVRAGVSQGRAAWCGTQFMIMAIRVDGGKRQWVWLGGR